MAGERDSVTWPSNAGVEAGNRRPVHLPVAQRRVGVVGDLVGRHLHFGDLEEPGCGVRCGAASSRPVEVEGDRESAGRLLDHLFVCIHQAAESGRPKHDEVRRHRRTHDHLEVRQR
jgi:hypothetical protein